MHETAYVAPHLEIFGTLRQLTLAARKSIVGNDNVPGIGLDCSPGDPGCLRS